MRRILITGGAGFIPSSLADRLVLDKNNFVVLVDNFLTGRTDNITKSVNAIFIKADVNNWGDISSIMNRYAFDFVFHYSAVVGVKRTIDNPNSVLSDLKGIENIFNLCKNTGVKRVFYSSSSEVYGEPVHLPQHEHETPLNSKLPYAVVKNMGECYCRSFKQEFGLDYTILRFFNTYGPKQSPDFVMSKFIHSALLNEKITIYGDGGQTRTFCYIQDNIDFTVNIFENDLFVNDVVNVGSNEITTILDLAKLIIELTASKSNLVFLPPLIEGDMTRRQPDISKMKSVLNRDLIDIETGIRSVIKSWCR